MRRPGISFLRIPLRSNLMPAGARAGIVVYADAAVGNPRQASVTHYERFSVG
jgi:hypothetical protein